jgi:2-keto-4-pentenoate hydratase
MSVTVDEQVLDGVAADLRGAYETDEPIKPVRDALELGGIDAAYAVQQRNTDIWVAQGRRIVGRKIGLTSEAVQRQLGVDQPDFGALFDDMGLTNGDAVPYGAVLQPRIEAEVALVLHRTLDDPDLTVDQLAAAVDHLLPALEVVGSRIVGWDITILDTIADNASSGVFVLGTTPVDPAGVDLRDVTMTLTADGAVASTGTGAACLGHPYNAALWLARRMVTEGTPLLAGDVIMSGALGPMIELAPGVAIEASIDRLGTVRTAREAPE